MFPVACRDLYFEIAERISVPSSDFRLRGRHTARRIGIGVLLKAAGDLVRSWRLFFLDFTDF